MIAGEIGARSRYESGKACDKVLGTEQDVRGAVVERVLELVDDLAGGIDREAVKTQCRPSNVTAQPLEAVALVWLTRHGAVQGEAVLIGGEAFGCCIGPVEGGVLEGEGSAASARSDGDTVADGRGVQVIQGVSGFQVERKLSQRLFGVFDEETDFVLGRESLRAMRWMRRLSRSSRVFVSGAVTRWNRGPSGSRV